jgi:hypothetical protein
VTAPAKLAGFAAALAVLFGGGALAGAAIGPDRNTAAPGQRAAASHADAGTGPAGRSAPMSTSTHTKHSSSTTQPANVRGLAVAAGGLRLVVEDPELRRGRAEQLAFRIVDEHGETVRDFDVEHEKRMHLILARRDLTGFQHLHPDQRPDGTWTATVRLDEPGSYRLFADFSHGERAQTLGTDLRVDGDADLRPLPPPQSTASSDAGYDVRLDAGEAHAGKEIELRFTISKDGVPVPTEPYLGAGGHLVALREGDLAFLHVHPAEHDHGETAKTAGEHDDSVGFVATFPTDGRYRLFMQFKREGRVQTVAFTQHVR